MKRDTTVQQLRKDVEELFTMIEKALVKEQSLLAKTMESERRARSVWTMLLIEIAENDKKNKDSFKGGSGKEATIGAEKQDKEQRLQQMNLQIRNQEQTIRNLLLQGTTTTNNTATSSTTRNSSDQTVDGNGGGDSSI